MSGGALARWFGSARGARLGIDYTLGPGHAPGAGRYVRELVRALVRHPDAPELRLVEFGLGPRPMDGPPLGLIGRDVVGRFERRRIGLPRRVLPAASPLVARAAARGVRLFHRVDPSMPAPRHVPTSLALLEFPAEPEALARLGAAARAAEHVIAFSVHAAVRACDEFGIRPPSVAAVGCEHWARELGDRLEGHPRRATRDVLVLGAIRASRRPLDVLRAFERLRARGTRARLLVIGRPGDAAAAWREALAASPARDDVRWIENPEEARMPEAVAGASALLHLADDEVSPVTPLEALRLGVPVVASALPAFREAARGSARFVDATDPDGVARALAEALEETHDGGPELRARLADATRLYTWKACADGHLLAWRTKLGSR